MGNPYELIKKQSVARIITKILILFYAILIFVSCSTTKNVVLWNVELKDSDMPITDRCNPNLKLQSIRTPEKPIMIPASEDREARIKVFGLPCSTNEEMPTYDIPVSRIKRITYVSDPLMPPQEIAIADLEQIQTCCRQRTGALFFDKLEIRGAIGYRGANDPVTYFDINGIPTVYNTKFIGFDRGGSTLFFGLEFAGLWNVPFIDKGGNFQAGIFLGIWPVDGSTFIPVGLDLRYTFNQKPAKYTGSCNSWYIYGNGGIPFDFTSKAPVFGKSWDFQRYFYGLGIGYDWAINCKLDFSLDVGFRTMNLPLPPCLACSMVSSDYTNPFRHSNALLLRFGLTF